jgi:adenine-specific DNA-methyltransferase
MEKLKCHTPDLTTDNVAKLAVLFPNCVVEAKDVQGKVTKSIDFDQLRQELSTFVVDGPRERYHLDWPGKREALLTANAPIAKTLRPSRKESEGFDTTKNIFIEGDNLDALKLLQETFLGKVKMIYIDPPYNTGSDFIYADDFTEDTETFFQRSNQKDSEGNRLVVNAESNGRFHSDWLTMMYPRLKLARNLLRDDGVVFVSIDDSESSNLKSILDEVFGEQNFIDTIAVEMSTTSGPKTVNAQQGTIVKNVEFVHVYSKSAEFDKAPHTPLLDGIDSYDTHYSVWLNDDGTLGTLAEKLLSDNRVGPEIRRYGFLDRDKFSINNMDRLLSVSEATKSFIDANLKKIARIDRPPVSAAERSTPIGRWQSFEVNNRTYFLTTLANGTLQALMPLSLNYRMSDDYKPRFGRTVIRGDLWKGFHQDMGNVAKEGDIAFSNGKKPVRLIKQLIKWANNTSDAIILDFFSGSATTAHAVMQLNAEDGGKRRHIMVQLPEPCDEKSEAFKAGFKTIAEIGKERIRRAGKKIMEEWEAQQAKEKPAQGRLVHLPSTTSNPTSPPDIGFRVLKIDTSNMKDVYYVPDAVKQADLVAHADNIKEDRTPEDLLFQVLVDWGVDLALPIAKETIAGKSVFFVDGNALAACFDSAISEDLVKELAKRRPLRAVFRDSSYGSDSVKINVEQIFKLLSPVTEIKSL